MSDQKSDSGAVLHGRATAHCMRYRHLSRLLGTARKTYTLWRLLSGYRTGCEARGVGNQHIYNSCSAVFASRTTFVN
jgi:hypothetical protein